MAAEGDFGAFDSDRDPDTPIDTKLVTIMDELRLMSAAFEAGRHVREENLDAIVTLLLRFPR